MKRESIDLAGFFIDYNGEGKAPLLGWDSGGDTLFMTATQANLFIQLSKFVLKKPDFFVAQLNVTFCLAFATVRHRTESCSQIQMAHFMFFPRRLSFPMPNGSVGTFPA